jgi:hypothetical protein
MILLALLTGGVFGSELSYFLGGLFPDGPVRNFFFQRLDIGIPATALKLGFINLTFGLSFAITTFTVLLIILFVWLVGRL